MKPFKPLTCEEKIARTASMVFAISMMVGFLYLLFTTSWLLHAVAIFNLAAVSGMIFMLVKEIIKTLMDKTR